MFSSLWSSTSADPTAPTFHPLTARYDVKAHPELLFGELETKDTEWLCAGGFTTETQVFYNVTDDGTFFWLQVIHSAVGLWYPTIQFTCKVYNPKTGAKIWKSVNVNNFVTPPQGSDKRSCKADEFSIIYQPSSPSKPPSTTSITYPESYTIRCNLGEELQISVNVNRVSTAAGFKVGSGPQGGYSYFGASIDKPDGYVIHRFWPLTHFDGHLIMNKKAEVVSGKGMMVHAIQGMRPNLVAASWNFGWFVSQKPENNEAGDGTVAIQMEFKTIDAYGMKGSGSGGVSVSVGCLVVDGKLATVVGETKVPGQEQIEGGEGGVMCRVKHLDPVFDEETGYNIPSQVVYNWSGPPVPGAGGKISAEVTVPFGKDMKNVQGLVDKTDVLAEIPYVIKMAVNYVAGTKPYIYQSINPGTLTIKNDKDAEVEGTIYNEATFIS